MDEVFQRVAFPCFQRIRDEEPLYLAGSSRLAYSRHNVLYTKFLQLPIGGRFTVLHRVELYTLVGKNLSRCPHIP